MSDKNRALEALADAYLARTQHQDAVRAKYAQFQRDLEDAKQADIDEVAHALVAAWRAGASVAASGRAMGAANIYNARRAYYARARALEGAENTEFLDRLFLKARGEKSSLEIGLEQSAAGETVDLGDFTQYGDVSDEVGALLDLRAWVESWTLEETGPGNYTVNDPEERVDKIIAGNIFGFRGKNATEFKDNAELHALVAEIHDIEMKEF